MIEIVSKRNGPRREDEAARRLIEANRPTIERLANHFSGGTWSQRHAPKPAAEAEGLIIHTARAATTDAPPKPFLRLAVNGRVSMVDANSGRQMHHIGEVRRRDGRTTFRLATRDNGFFSPVDDTLAAALADLDGQPVEDRAAERSLIDAIGGRLGIA